MRDLVSVIVPVYNVARYLDDAVSSVLRQTYPHWELLLVDDGSTDNSGMLCDTFAAHDSRIHVFHTENGGLSHARNVGISHASGQWYQFLDGDDMLADNALETALSYAGEANVVIYGLEQFPRRTVFQCVEAPCRYPSFRDAVVDIEKLFSRGVFFNACSKLYRSSHFSLPFDVTVTHAEDILFNLEYLPCCGELCIIPDLLYLHRRSGHRTLSGTFWADHFELNKRIYHCAIQALGDQLEGRVFFHQYFALEAVKYATMLTTITNISRNEQHLLFELLLEDEIFRNDDIRSVRLSGTRQLLWLSLLSGHSRYAFRLFSLAGRTLLHWKNKY